MSKKLLFIIGIATTVMFAFLVPFCFGTDGNSVMNDAVNGIRNTVGGAEDTIENAIHDVTNGTNNNMSYSANRTATSTTANTGTFLGMSSTAWTWLILAIAAILIIALVWYYTSNTSKRRYDNYDE